MKLLLDTNTLSYLLRREEIVRAHFERARNAEDTLFLLSPMVDLEIRRYLLLKGASRNLQQYEALIADWQRVELTEADWHLAATTWAERHRVGQPIEDADLLIAVSALRHGAIIVTSNLRHFADLGIELVDWREPGDR